MNKISKYTHWVEDGEYVIAFNLASNGCLLLNKDLSNLVMEHKSNIDQLQQLHPDFYAQMLQMKLIVPENSDEVKELVAEWERQDNDTSSFSMIINPTLGCNLRCWYCYENHNRMPMMEDKVVESIYRLLDKKTRNPILKKLNVSFFGGEPLLGLEQVVLPVLSYAAMLCKKNGISLSSNFTTNGVLLSAETLNKLDAIKMDHTASFQISLDGNRDFHDQSRIGIHKEPTYETIIHNIKQAVASQHMVYVRLNYTAANISSFADVLEDFTMLSDTEKTFVKFNFQQIWQDQRQNDVTSLMLDMKDLFRKEGFEVDSDHICHRHVCYADCENHIVINYDGYLFKCTARDFNQNRSEGRLTEDGDIVWNEKYHQRMHIKYTNKACLNCSILPICNGGCTQKKLDAHNTDKCYIGMNEEAKNERILHWLKKLIMSNHTKKTECYEK